MGYPLALLRLSLAFCRWSKRLVVDGVLEDELKPLNGVGPVSAHAISKLAVYLAEDVRRISSKPGERVSLHMDDFTIEVTAPTSVDACRMLVKNELTLLVMWSRIKVCCVKLLGQA